eukprot:sb/3463206/
MLSLLKPVDIPFQIFHNIPSLEHITMDYCNSPKFIGRSFEVVPKLKGLSIRYSGVEGIDFRAVQGTSVLKWIWLDGNKLQTFQHGMFMAGQFPLLVEIHLSDNLITDVEWFSPKEFIPRGLMVKTALSTINETSFSKLPSLRIINLDTNSVSHIRDGTFEHVGTLEELYLGHNDLLFDTVEPNAFTGLENLVRLSLESNKLRAVPTAVYSLKKLLFLSMSSNKLTFIRAGDFTTMDALETLLLDRNRLLLVEDKSFSPSLRALYLDNNELTFIQEHPFDDLPSLEDLGLSNNQFRMLPKDVFRHNTKLRSLNLRGNELRFLNSSHFSTNPLSSMIDVSHNQISYIEAGTFSHVRKTQYILLQHNEIRDIPGDGMFQDLTADIIRLDHNQITRIKSRTFNNIVCKYFKLNDNDIVEIESHGFSNIEVKRLGDDYKDSFDLSNNPLRRLHEYSFSDITVGYKVMFTNVRPLEIIPTLAFNKITTNAWDFSNNDLTMIQYKGFHDIEVTTELSLSEVGLEYLDRNAISGKVGNLNLARNNLRRIPESALYHVTFNRHLYLQHNFIDIIESNALPDTQDHLFLYNNNITLYCFSYKPLLLFRV